MTRSEAFSSASAFLSSAPLQNCDAQTQQVLLTLYRLLAQGRAVSPKQLATTVDLDIEDVERAISQVSNSVLQYSERGEVVGFGGLSISPTEHRISIGDVSLYTWCAFDSLFASELLDVSIDVRSICPLSGADISIRVSPDGIEYAEPATTVVTFVTPDRVACLEDIRSAFCRHVHFLRSGELAPAWAAKNPNTLILSLEDAFALGHQRNQRSFGKVIN